MSLSGGGAIPRAARAIVMAGALWREGFMSEAHAYMASALRAALKPWFSDGGEASRVQADEQPATHEEALAALARSGYRNVDRLREALLATADVAILERAGLPAVYPPPDFEWIWAEADRLCRFGARRLATPLERKRARARLAFAGALGVVLLGVMFVRVWMRPHVSASGVFSSEFPATYAVDGIESTEWLPPDHAPAWVQLSFSSPRRVHAVLVLNGHNKFHMDRAAERIRVTAFSKTGPVASAEGRFANLTADRSPLNLAIDAERVTDVRVDILSYFGNGGALAEVEVR